jgi:drug/metabolite transporter (DMT)-like permease
MPSAPDRHHVPSPLGARLSVLAAAALFSSGGAAVKAVHLNGWQVACFRSLVAAAVLAVFLPEARRRPTRHVLGVAAVYATTMVLFVLSNKLTTSASAIFLQATAPLHVVLLSPWLLGERVRRADLVFMAVLALGLGCFFVGTDPATAMAPNPLLGNTLAALSGLTWALTVIGLRALGRAGGGGGRGVNWGPAAALWGNVLACLFCLAKALPVAGSAADWGTVAYLGAFQVGLAYIFLLRGIGGVRALEASLLLLLEPVLNPVWSWIVHGERPGAWSLAGGAVILTASLVKSWWDGRLAARPASLP